MNMKYFKDIKTISELKREYYKLAKQYHPDVGGTTEIMQKINGEYDILFVLLKNRINYDDYDNQTAEEKQNYTYKTEMPSDYQDIISKIIHFENCELEICGYWIWLSGETKSYKDILKSLKFRWSNNKQAWYWRNNESKCFKKGKLKSMDEIREIYGSQKISTVYNEKISA